MNTQVIVNGRTYTIPSDKVQHIVALLEAYKTTQAPQQQVREVLTNFPNNENRVLING